MSKVIESESVVNNNENHRWSRIERANGLENYKILRQSGFTQRAAAKKIGIARTTLQDWLRWGDSLDMHPELVAFFESSAGLAFLHRLVTGLHMVFVESGACGIRLVSQFLHLSGLDCFVASSFEAQREVNVSVQESIVTYTQLETTRLARNMSPRDITVAQDETFTGGLTLVGIEPVSGYILLEKKTTNRDSETWKIAMEEATQHLNCKIIQSTSDEGSGILAYVEHSLKAQHSPDLFHIQQDLTRAVSGPLAAKARSVEKQTEQAMKDLEAIKTKAEIYQQHPELRGPGRPPHFETQIQIAESVLSECNSEVIRIEEARDEVKSAIKSISENYHYVDPKTGKRYSGSIIRENLQQSIDKVRIIAEEEGLGDTSFDRINKAERVLPKMEATLNFVSSYVGQQVDKMQLNSTETYAMHNNLIAPYYLERIANNKPIDDAQPLLNLASQLRDQLFSSGGIFSSLDPQRRRELEDKAQELANIFQRSSSCVEGRNGVLSFRNHELHCISPRKQTVLTAMHNFFIERSDGTTAAQRFFGSKPINMFKDVLSRVKIPALPRNPPTKTQDAQLTIH